MRGWKQAPAIITSALGDDEKFRHSFECNAFAYTQRSIHNDEMTLPKLLINDLSFRILSLSSRSHLMLMGSVWTKRRSRKALFVNWMCLNGLFNLEILCCISSWLSWYKIWKFSDKNYVGAIQVLGLRLCRTWIKNDYYFFSVHL
jgi:hypothetical protein